MILVSTFKAFAASKDQSAKSKIKKSAKLWKCKIIQSANYAMWKSMQSAKSCKVPNYAYCTIMQSKKLCKVQNHPQCKVKQHAKLCKVQNYVYCKIMKVQNYV